MVRAHVKQPAEEKKTASKKETKYKTKRVPETGVWPCKINGCNKEFAREADLKRHQRTTKLHSPAGVCVSCPQCEATFTRTDALRRHQKSRHNGVIMDPVTITTGVVEGEEDEAGSQVSGGSRAGTPRTRAKASTSANATPSTMAVPTVLARPDTAGPASGPQSYYRPHTLNAVFVPPRTPHGVLDTSYQAGKQLPTSATRLHNAQWPPAPPWVQDSALPRGPPPPPPGPYTMPGPPHGPYYTPGTYYRAPNGQPPMGALTQMPVGPHGHSPEHGGPGSQDAVPMQMQPPQPPQPIQMNNIDPSLASSGTEQQTNGELPQEQQAEQNGALAYQVQEALAAVLAIDPSLAPLAAQPQEVKSEPATVNPNTNGINGTGADAIVPPAQASTSTDSIAPPTATEMDEDKVDLDMDADADGEADVDPDCILPGEGEDLNAVKAERPAVTDENGEPMLRPDEILNEESLRSPPP